MARLLILISLLPIFVVAAARWWFWSRAQRKGMRMQCSISTGELVETLNCKKDIAGKNPELRDAASLGDALREAGLRLLEKDGITLAKRRRRGWWNLRALPILWIVISVFSLATRRVPFTWVLAIGLFVIAIHVIVRVSGISIELAAVDRAWKEFRHKTKLHRVDEEKMILHCARRSVWHKVLPW